MTKTGMGRPAAVFFTCVLSMFACAYLMPGVTMESYEQTLLMGVLLGAVYVALRPLARLIAFPLGCLTVGLGYVALDAGIVLWCDRIVEGFAVDGPLWAVAVSVFVNAICAAVGAFNR